MRRDLTIHIVVTLYGSEDCVCNYKLGTTHHYFNHLFSNTIPTLTGLPSIPRTNNKNLKHLKSIFLWLFILLARMKESIIKGLIEANDPIDLL